MLPPLAFGQATGPGPGGYSQNPDTPFNYGSDEEKGLGDISKSIFSGAMSLISSFSFNGAVIKILNWIADVFVLVMKFFWSLVGPILIVNIDFTNANSFTNALGFKTVSNIYTLFVSIGVCCALSFFFLHLGQNAVGLGRIEISFRSLVRLMVALSVLLILPYFTSFMALWSNSISQLIYQQNQMNTSGALDGLSNLAASTFSQSAPVQPVIAQTDLTAASNVRAGFLMLLNFSYFVAFIGCIIGMAIGSYKISANANNGVRIFVGACLGLIFLFGAFELTRYLFGSGAAIFGGNTNQITSAQAYNGYTFNIPQPIPSQPTTTDSSSFWGGIMDVFKSQATSEEQIGLTLIAVIIKIFVSIYGCWIIAKVFFGKIFQLLTLAALFLISPLLAATISHPAMEGIAISGLKYTIKYYLYSVVWAIAIVFMFIISSINFGFTSMGAQNFETALAMLGGLIFIEKVEGLVGLLTGTGGPTVEGAMKDFGQFSASVIGGATAAFGATAAAVGISKSSLGESFGAHHMAGAIAGGAAGFMAPVLGAGTTAKMAASAGIKMANTMGNFFNQSGNGSAPTAPGPSSFNPYDTVGSSANADLSTNLQNLTSTLQTRSLSQKGPSGQGKGN